MKSWIIAGVLTAFTAPAAFASESTEACQLDEARRREQETAAASQPVPRPLEAVRPEAAEQQARVARRRSGRRIPDAELIGPRGAL